MPITHFAFGGLHRAGEYSEQLQKFIELILLPRNLRAAVCPEFLPIISKPGSMTADPDSVRDVGDGSVTFDRFVPSPPVGLLPHDVSMLSFVDIPFKKLKSWPALEHYGRLGVAFTDKFRRRMGVRSVGYYQYPALQRDPLVVELNQIISQSKSVRRNQLLTKIVNYRKPARLWPEINGLFAALKLTKNVDGSVTSEKQTYSRYEEGYDFQIEREARLVTDKSAPDVGFEESDVLAIMVPGEAEETYIREALRGKWDGDPSFLRLDTEI